MMAMQFAISVVDQSQIGEARRQATKIAQEAGCGENQCAQVALAVTELATNLVRYAQQGEILIRAESLSDRNEIEVFSIDRGPGIGDVGRSLTDGYSTGGTSGTGLGAVQRLCSIFEVYSSVPKGTVIYCRIADGSPERRTPQIFHWGVINRPAPYESVSGDTWRIATQSEQLSIMLVDGLGHGPEAAEAAQEAANVFSADPFADLATLFAHAHQRMHGTRGGALAVAQIDLTSRTMKYLGIGNISGSLRANGNGAGRGLVSHNGTVGMQVRKSQEFSYEFPTDSLLVMYSDGLQSRWSFDDYPGLAQRHPGVIAGVLYRDFCRGRDDVTVAVVRMAKWGGQN